METYTRDEVRQASLAFFSGDELATDVFIEKYAVRDSEERFTERSPSEAALRMSQEFARTEAKYENALSAEEIYRLLMNVPTSIPDVTELPDLIDATVGYGPIIPQGSPQSAMGNPFQIQSLSNCFVIDSPYDSYGGICHTDEEQAQIMKRRGGVGFDVSTIRPKGQPTSNAARTTDGLGVFMERYSNTTREVAQNGRRGALMLTISINHPEIETFINIKRDKQKVTGANVSIRVNDEFMQAVKDDAEYDLRWPVDAKPEDASIVRRVNARKIWDQIIDAAWYSAEPGVLFWDTAKSRSPADAYAEFGFFSMATNPCGEIVLSPYDSCRLMVIDVRKFVVNPWTPEAYFDLAYFRKIVHIAQKLMDDLVDLEIEAVEKIIEKVKNDPEPEHIKRNEIELWTRIKKTAENGRRTGLGMTALGDALASLGVKYGSPESIETVESIYKMLAVASYESSIDLAEQRGHFNVWDFNIDMKHPFLVQVYNELSQEYRQKWAKFGRRNIANTTTPPAGTMSILLQSTNGLEPLFSIDPIIRRKKVSEGSQHIDFVDEKGDTWQEYRVYHKGLEQWMHATGNDDVAQSPYAGACAQDIDWESGVRLQSVAQKWVCHSISRTGNFPKHASHDDISRVYMLAWELGCKGFTVYRDGSRSGVMLTGASVKAWFDDVPDAEIEKAIEIGQSARYAMPTRYLEFLEEASQELARRLEGDNRPTVEIFQAASKRPKKLPCDIHRVRVMVHGESESYLALVGLMGGEPYEIFCGLSKHVDLPRKYTTGWIIKNGRKKPGNIATYNLVIGEGDDEIVFKDIVEQFDNPNYGAFSRTLSLVLRHKIPIQFLTEQLQKDKHSDISSWSRAIARVLKGYIPDGTTTTLDKICPQCGSEGIVYQSGCPSCKSCGWSKCL